MDVVPVVTNHQKAEKLVALLGATLGGKSGPVECTKAFYLWYQTNGTWECLDVLHTAVSRLNPPHRKSPIVRFILIDATSQTNLEFTLDKVTGKVIKVGVLVCRLPKRKSDKELRQLAGHWAGMGLSSPTPFRPVR